MAIGILLATKIGRFSSGPLILVKAGNAARRSDDGG
jgi:hypothetical protein